MVFIIKLINIFLKIVTCNEHVFRLWYVISILNMNSLKSSQYGYWHAKLTMVTLNENPLPWYPNEQSQPKSWANLDMKTFKP